MLSFMECLRLTLYVVAWFALIGLTFFSFMLPFAAGNLGLFTFSLPMALLFLAGAIFTMNKALG